MAAKIHLNNFRFSIYIDADGTVTLTDLPPELREVVEALNPAHQWGTTCAISPLPGALPPAQWVRLRGSDQAARRWRLSIAALWCPQPWSGDCHPARVLLLQRFSH